MGDFNAVISWLLPTWENGYIHLKFGWIFPNTCMINIFKKLVISFAYLLFGLNQVVKSVAETGGGVHRYQCFKKIRQLTQQTQNSLCISAQQLVNLKHVWGYRLFSHVQYWNFTCQQNCHSLIEVFSGYHVLLKKEDSCVFSESK